MNAYMSYKVSTQVHKSFPVTVFCIVQSTYINIMALYHDSLSLQTTLPMFLNKTFSVRRRFSDFLGLYETISSKHTLLGCIIPPPPQKSVVGKEFLMLPLDPCLVELF